MNDIPRINHTASEIGPLGHLAIVVPCFNEQDGVGLLADRLFALEKLLDPASKAEFILIDDGSTDGTKNLLSQTFDPRPNYRVISHPANRGIAAAIHTGIQSTDAMLVCSIDADCSYDPKLLVELLRLMDDDVSVVTASPYHPDGSVEGVDGWRLGLSKFASLIYGLLLDNKLHTYTSCFRVHRRESVASLHLSNPGFVGITELLWQLDRRGHRIVEVPATLTRRRFGISKMNTMRSGIQHLRLMSTIVCRRFTRNLKRSDTNVHQSVGPTKI